MKDEHKTGYYSFPTRPQKGELKEREAITTHFNPSHKHNPRSHTLITAQQQPCITPELILILALN